ncbi:hypothetical protein ACSQ5K_13695 [Pseudomonas sp. PhalM4]
MINQQHSSLLRGDLLRLPGSGSLAEQCANRHLLLTGATGFFGRWLLALFDELNRQGAGINVTVVSRNPNRFLDDEPHYRNCSWLSWVPTDIRDLRQLPGRPVELILHGAADTSAAAHARPLELLTLSSRERVGFLTWQYATMARGYCLPVLERSTQRSLLQGE